jgi:hypothetical protein
MARDFSSETLVVLPRLDADSALALWQALQAEAEAAKKLPKVLQPAWQGVASAGNTLFQAARSRFMDSGRATPSERRAADGVVDNVVGALDDYLAAWMRLVGTPEAQIATSVRQTLFPDGLGFLNFTYEQEWAQIDRRLDLIKSEGLDKQIATLGGTTFVTQLQKAHQAYGKALALTTVQPTPAETATLGEALQAFASALRRYVIKVTAYGDEAEAAPAELAERLLRPLAAWSSKSYKTSDAGEPEPESGDPATTAAEPPAGAATAAGDKPATS